MGVQACARSLHTHMSQPDPGLLWPQSQEAPTPSSRGSSSCHLNKRRFGGSPLGSSSGPCSAWFTTILASCLQKEGRKEKSPFHPRMTLNPQQDTKTPLRRRASTPLTLSPRGHQPGLLCAAPSTKSQHPRLGQSASLNPPTRQPSPAPNGWSSESSDSEGSWEALYRVVLLGDPGVGKTSLASLFAGKQERDLHEQLGGRDPVGWVGMWPKE